MTLMPVELLSSPAGLCVPGFLLLSILLECSASGWLHPNRSLMRLWLWSDPQMAGQLSARLNLSSGLNMGISNLYGRLYRNLPLTGINACGPAKDTLYQC